jgi:hypothetical protein
MGLQSRFPVAILGDLDAPAERKVLWSGARYEEGFFRTLASRILEDNLSLNTVPGEEPTLVGDQLPAVGGRVRGDSCRIRHLEAEPVDEFGDGELAPTRYAARIAKLDNDPAEVLPVGGSIGRFTCRSQVNTTTLLSRGVVPLSPRSKRSGGDADGEGDTGGLGDGDGLAAGPSEAGGLHATSNRAASAMVLMEPMETPKARGRNEHGPALCPRCPIVEVPLPQSIDKRRLVTRTAALNWKVDLGGKLVNPRGRESPRSPPRSGSGAPSRRVARPAES